MVTHTIFYLTIVFSLISLSVQNLNKTPLFSGLADLDFSFLKLPRRHLYSGGDTSLCRCNDAELPSVNTIKYVGSPDQSLVLCICQNAVMNDTYMIRKMGKVPYAIRLNNKAMTSATQGQCGGAASGGDVTIFCDENMPVTVFIHESAHSFDKGKSASQAWYNAVANDTCVPDPYSNTNYAEDFAQVVVVWVHLVGIGKYKNLGGSKFTCMKNQLGLMATYLPGYTLLTN